MMFEFFVCKEHPQQRNAEWIGLTYNHLQLKDGPLEDSLISFCFPLRSEAHTTKRLSASEEYCFVTTGSSGDRSHGFCRRVYLGEYPKKLPVVFCIVAPQLWSLFFYKALEVLEHLIHFDNLLGLHLPNELPANSTPAQFLKSLQAGLEAKGSIPGAIIKLPFPSSLKKLSIDPVQKIPSLCGTCPDLKCTSEFIDLQIPPLTGGGRPMAGVSLARLLWRIPVQCLMTLFASLLLERRIIMVSTKKDTLSSCVHAAAALIYPFEWSHRFYLPIMPDSLRSYLEAPMPFLIGLPAELMDFRGLQMDEVTIIDLDLGTCLPKPGSKADDAFHLPLREKLQDNLHQAVKALRSPTEFEGNQRIAGCVVDYMVRLFKSYRDFLTPKKDTNKLKTRGMAGSKLKSQNSVSSTKSIGDDFLVGSGIMFNHQEFVASHKKEKDRIFLNMFRESQMYEVFVQQRMEMAAQGKYPNDDPFENQINLIREHRTVKGRLQHHSWSRRYSTRVGGRYRDSAKLRNCHSLIGVMGQQQDEKNRSIEMKVRKRSMGGEASAKDEFTKSFNLNKTEDSKTILTVVREMAADSAKEESKAIEPGNFLKMSRASFSEKGLDHIPHYELGEPSIHSSLRCTLEYEKNSSGPLIMLDEEELIAEIRDEFDGFPSASPGTPSLESLDLDGLPVEGNKVQGSHEDSVRGKAMEFEFNQMNKKKVVGPETSFRFSDEEFKEKLFSVRSHGGRRSLEVEDSAEAMESRSEQISKEYKNETERKVDKIMNESLKGLTDSSVKQYGLPSSNGQRRSIKSPPPVLLRTKAFAYGKPDHEDEEE